MWNIKELVVIQPKTNLWKKFKLNEFLTEYNINFYLIEDDFDPSKDFDSFKEFIAPNTNLFESLDELLYLDEEDYYAIQNRLPFDDFSDFCIFRQFMQNNNLFIGSNSTGHTYFEWLFLSISDKIVSHSPYCQTNTTLINEAFRELLKIIERQNNVLIYFKID